jgi:hypothetical protein
VTATTSGVDPYAAAIAVLAKEIKDVTKAGRPVIGIAYRAALPTNWPRAIVAGGASGVTQVILLFLSQKAPIDAGDIRGIFAYEKLGRLKLTLLVTDWFMPEAKKSKSGTRFGAQWFVGNRRVAWLTGGITAVANLRCARCASQRLNCACVAAHNGLGVGNVVGDLRIKPGTHP